MKFAFTDEQLELRRGARRFLDKHSSATAVRKVMDTELGYDPAVWKQISEELGWSALIIPDEYDGVGLGYVELVALMEEMGRALLCSPFFSTVCLGANALLLAADDSQKKRWLPGIAAGTTTATLALTDETEMSVAHTDDGYVLTGTKTFVVDGHSADLLIVADGIDLYVVPADTDGVSRELLPTMDQTRRLARVSLDNVTVPGHSKLNGASDVLPRILDLACIALSAEQVGGAERCLELSVDYAKTRTQFGKPIGSFQAIKHKCADMLTMVESARSASYWAGWAASVDDDELTFAAPLAKATCSDAYFSCAAEAIQIHGGVGFTWECDVHLYFKRAKSSESLLGAPAHHREQLAKRMDW